MHRANVLHLSEVVVDIETSASLLQEEDQRVDDGQLSLHDRYMQSSVMDTNIDTRIFTPRAEREIVCRKLFILTW